MSRAADPTMDWAVLARPSGEVLTAQAESPGLHLGLLGVPQGFEAKEAEGWLYDVIGVAHESSPAPSGSPSIPALLHHALTGLLFSHGELWERPGVPRPCSFAFVHAVQEVGFGWVGDAAVMVWVDGQPHEPEWVKVRDEAGREALAWSIPSNHRLHVRIQWSASPAGESTTGAEVEAVWSTSAGEPNAAAPSTSPMISTVGPAEPGWPGAAEIRPILEQEPVAGGPDHSRDTVGSLEARAEDIGATLETVVSEEMAVAAAAPEAATPEAAARPEGAEEGAAAAGGGSRFTRWLRRRFSWFTGGRKDAAGEPHEPPAAEAEATSGSDPIATAGDAPVTLPDLIPPTPEPADVTRSAEPAVRPAVERPASAPPIWRGVPEHIPPSPEPADLTSRAVRSAELPDPHMIVLPPPAAPSHSAVVAIGLSPSTVDPRVTAGEVSTPAESPLEHGEHPGEPTTVEPTAAAAPSVEPAPTLVAPTAPAVEEAHQSPTDPVQPVASAPSAVVTPAPPEAALPEPAPPIRSVRAAHRTAPPQRPAWPTPQQLAREEVPLWRRPWVWGLAVVALFVGGWLVGSMQDAGHPRDASGRGAMGRALHALGLGGPRFTVNVNSRPPGAWIAVDGKTLTLRTPAVVELAPGEHTVGLSFPDLGGASYTVRGLKGERVPLDATLWGALEVYSPNEVGIIGVVVDGEPRGFAPLRVDSLTPGVHEVRFSAPGMVPWGQTVDIRVGESKELLARATPSPATGVLQVQASMTDEQGTQPAKGGQVWIDGEPRGTTPLTLDLPRGPHSVRLVYKGQQAPIQVLDLPGGNQRFAVFEFGLDIEVPQLIADVPARIPRYRPAVVSASLPGVGARDVREMWLHVQMGEGPWRRNAMTLLKAPAGVVGVAVFPPSAFDGQGRARYYMSAQYGQGDESFTEIRTAQLEKSATR